MRLKLFLAFSFLGELSLNRKAYKQRQRGGGQAFARSRFFRVLVSLSLGDIIISLKKKPPELFLLISAFSTSLARAVHSSATVLPPPLVTGCAAAAED